MTFPKLSGFIYFSKTAPGLEIAILEFHDPGFSMTLLSFINEPCFNIFLWICAGFNAYHPINKQTSLFLHFFFPFQKWLM